MIFRDLGVQVGSKNKKERCKFKVQHKVPPGIDLLLILVGFGRQIGGGNRAKIDKNWIQKGIPKMMTK